MSMSTETGFAEYSFTRLEDGEWGVRALEELHQESQEGDVIEVEKKNGDTSEVRLGQRVGEYDRHRIGYGWVTYEIDS